MLPRILVATVAALTVAVAPQAAHAGSAKLYLNELSEDCGEGTQNVITNVAEDEGACIYVPRLLVDGEGLQTTSESYTSVKKLKTFRVDATKRLTGRFELFGGSGLRNVSSGAVVTADFTIKIAKKKVGVVRVEGVTSSAAPLAKTFTITIPSALHRVRTNSVNVTVDWVTCVGLCGVEVSGASYVVVPTR